VSVFADGGFGAASQSAYTALAGVTLLLTVWLLPRATSTAACSPIVLALGALATLGVASVIWTISGQADTAVRWGLVFAAHGAVFIAACAFTRIVGPQPLLAGIVLVASSEAILGLIAVASRQPPMAEPIDGSWHPGGTFQYPPALALLQVATIPILSRGLERAPAIAIAAGSGAILSGATIALAESRLAIVSAACLLVVLVLGPRASAPSRLTATVLSLLVLTGALGGTALFDTSAEHEPGSAGLAGSGRSGGTLRSDWSDPLHGRDREWLAAAETWLDRPLLGAGAGAYYIASLRHQGKSPTLFAHDLPLELAAELGTAGLLVAAILYAGVAKLLAGARRNPAARLLAPLVVLFTLSSLVDWTWHLAGFAALWAAAAGGLQALRPVKRIAENNPQRLRKWVVNCRSGR
jgi:O-Antigen ligase